MKGRYKGVIVLGIAALIGAAAYYYFQQSPSKSEEIAEIAEKIKERDETPAVEAEEPPAKSANAALPDMEETQVQTYLHHMTHQKVKADKKWGAVEMTPQNIGDLLVIVNANAKLYEHGQYYQTVLKEWQTGDFSNSVEVHNFIWNLQGGTVGRATGLLDEQEEQAYVEKNFSE